MFEALSVHLEVPNTEVVAYSRQLERLPPKNFAKPAARRGCSIKQSICGRRFVPALQRLQTFSCVPKLLGRQLSTRWALEIEERIGVKQ